MTAMMTIGDFSRRTGLSVSALRFYAGRGLLAPADIDESSGYRRYAEEQVADGRLVCDLRRLDMSLVEIERALVLAVPDRTELIDRHLRRLEQAVHRARTVAQTMSGEPIMEKDIMPATTLEAPDLSHAFDQVLPAAGIDPEVPHLMGVLIEAKQGSLRVVATDRHRLAIRDLVPTALDRDFSVVVPAASVAKWREHLGQAASASLQLTDRDFIVTVGERELSAMRLPIEFPDYEVFLQSGAQATSALVAQGELLAALEEFHGDDAVLFATSSTGLSLTRGNESRAISASCEGPDQQVAINPTFVADAARNAVGAEIVIEIEDPLKAVVFRSADNGTYTSLVMPVDLDEAADAADAGNGR